MYIRGVFSDRPVSCLCKQPSRKIFAQDNSGPHYRGGWSFLSLAETTVVQVRVEERRGIARRDVGNARENEGERGTGRKGKGAEGGRLIRHA